MSSVGTKKADGVDAIKSKKLTAFREIQGGKLVKAIKHASTISCCWMLESNFVLTIEKTRPSPAEIMFQKTLGASRDIYQRDAQREGKSTAPTRSTENGPSLVCAPMILARLIKDRIRENSMENENENPFTADLLFSANKSLSFSKECRASCWIWRSISQNTITWWQDRPRQV